MTKKMPGKQNTGKLSLINYKKFRYFLKNSDEISENSDWLSVVFYVDLQPFTNIIDILDVDNAQEYFDPETDVYYTKFTSGLGFGVSGYITYNQQPKKIFDYVQFYGNRKNLKAKGKLQLTGNYFRLSELKEIKENLISDIIKNKEEDLGNSYITRYDYRIDFMQYENTEKKKLNITPDLFKYRKNQKIGRTFGKVKEVDEEGKIKKQTYETIEHGSKTSGRVWIRLYNKLLEIDKKNKFEYFDYKRFSNVIRMELQCEIKFTGDYNFLEFYKLKNKLKELLDEKYNGRIYKPIRHLDIKYWTEEEKRKYAKKSIQPMYKMYQAGYNPTDGFIDFIQEERVKDGKKLLNQDEINEATKSFDILFNSILYQLKEQDNKDIEDEMKKPVSKQKDIEYMEQLEQQKKDYE